MKEISMEARTENIDAITDFINAGLEALDCPLKAQTQIDVAVDEILANISSYAYAPGIGPVTVRFEADADPPAAVITFMDTGIPFDPLQNADPDISLPAEAREVGGLGVFLVRRIMDEVRYEHRDGMNVLQIKKYF